MTSLQVCRGADAAMLHRGGAAVALPRPAVRARLGRSLPHKVSHCFLSCSTWGGGGGVEGDEWEGLMSTLSYSPC